MKLKEKNNLRGKKVDELYNMVYQFKQEIAKLRLEMKMGKQKDVNIARKKSKDIAFIKTIIKMKENEK